MWLYGRKPGIRERWDKGFWEMGDSGRNVKIWGKNGRDW